MQNIPGYYFDVEKNRYFKEQKGAPAEKAFSSHDIKRRKLRDEYSSLSDASANSRRAKIIETSISGGFLSRELGLGNHPKVPEIFAAGLKPSRNVYEFDSSLEVDDAVFDVEYRENKTVAGSATVECRIAYNSGMVRSYWRDQVSRFDFKMGRRSSTYLHGHDGTPSSMSSNEECSRHLTTVMTDNGLAGMVIISLRGPNREQTEDQHPIMMAGPGNSRGNHTNVFSSAPANNNPSIYFACGTSHGILSIDKNLSPSWITPSKDPDTGRVPESCPKDIFALQFLSEAPSVLLSGGREGLLQISDMRVPHPFQDNIDYIYHPSTIAHIKQLDTHRIIVAGLNSSLCQYDLRYRGKDNLKRVPVNIQNRFQQVGNYHRYATRPIVEYPEYFNIATIRCGFDVDIASGIVAASQEQDEQHPAIQLFSLDGGHVLKSALQTDPHTRPNRNYDGDHIRCLRFARDTENGMKSLYFMTKDQIHHYSWEHLGCDEA
ncbi:hypothetical protein HYALB_00000210 [Hymenoscyphus albidus]|uniref:Myocyte-specific enhancer factor 2d n=1 Tax=Hymenoscyphus albidus TaxID=595503 RepID=A0A9N9Q9K3_9HELO|nr:hypothetical protein HYALB_00000210 [Hymenoscyphus albidus]